VASRVTVVAGGKHYVAILAGRTQLMSSFMGSVGAKIINATPQGGTEGHSLFNDNCEHCHGPDAVDGIEECNLRHLALRYGNKMDQVFMYTVTHGRPSKGMPNWSGILTQAQFRNILAYLQSIQQH
jgi:polar amino acid transport system substrate-binding protein